MQKNISSFKKAQRPVKVLQFGAGNFLRGFCDWMIDILNEKTDFNGNVQIIQPLRKGKGIPLAEQNGIYYVDNGNDYRLITCIDSIVDPYKDDFLSTVELRDLEFVISNSTEAGIVFNKSEETFPARATRVLHECFKKYPHKKITFLPCELIEKNGDTLKSVIHQYIDFWDLPSDFKDWVNTNISFRNTLVDRIVPGYADISSRTGVEDRFTVMVEPFHFWVIEGEPLFPYKEGGLNILFVPDITPYRTQKVRILNGAHTALVPVAYLKGLRTVRESVEDPEVGSYLMTAIHDEIIPTLDLPATKFADEVIERFRNPYINHELASIALNSVSKYKVRVLPTVLRYIELKSELPKRLLYSLAALIELYKHPINDTPEVIEFFKEAWASRDAVHVAKVVLGNRTFWGIDLNEIEGLNKLVTEDLKLFQVNA